MFLSNTAQRQYQSCAADLVLYRNSVFMRCCLKDTSKKPHAANLHRIFSRHLAQKILTYVSMSLACRLGRCCCLAATSATGRPHPAIMLCNLPNKSPAHLNDGRFFEMPLIIFQIAFFSKLRKLSAAVSCC